MNEKQAIDIYFSKTPRSNGLVRRIALWEEEKTISENMKIGSHGSYGVAIMFSRRYGLSYKKSRKNGVRTTKDSIETMIKSGLKQADIARLLNCSRQRIDQILHCGVK